jgi:ELWxxDGT repeat protein
MLWATDGTEGGTVPLFGMAPGPSFVSNGPATVFRDFLYFARGDEFWRTDGTPGGTELLTELFPGLGGEITALAATQAGLLLGAISNGDPTTSLWTSDGTAAGTRLVVSFDGRDLFEYPPLAFTPVGDEVVFTLGIGVSGPMLWRSDGTRDGTRPLAPPDVGVGTTRPANFLAMDGRLLLTAADVDAGLELWTSDGTEEGTTRVQDIAPGPWSSIPKNFAVAGDRVFFSAGDEETGFELWVGHAAILTRQPTRALADLLAEVDAAGLQAGESRSLRAKLESVGKALAVGDPRRSGNLLEAFLNQVEALRGKKIADSRADDLVSFARELSALLEP